MTRDGATVGLTPKAFDVLLMLVENNGALVEKSLLLSAVWPGTFVEENTLTRNIADLRKALGKSPSGQPFIETVPKFGYRFVEPVNVPQPEVPAPPPRSHQVFFLAVGLGVLLLAVAGFAWTRSSAGHIGPNRLTGESGLNLDPALSPSGDRIAYASDRGGGTLEIWLADLKGGQPVQLTRNGADNSDPVFSPDGRLIAFHSEQDHGGVYVMPVQGGEERRIADFGRGPQFSPDGTQIAYWVGDIPSGDARIYVIPSAGGTPRRIDGACGYAAGSPLWSPDGRYLLYWCKSHIEGVATRDQDWFVARVEDGAEAKTNAAPVLKAQGLLPDNEVFTPSAWIGNQIVFAASQAGKVGIWRVSIAPDIWRVSGKAEQLTFADRPVRKASVSAGPHGALQMLFAAVSESSDIWALPVDANRGATTGAIRRLTNDPAGADYPSASADGKVIAYISHRGQSESLWAKDLRAGVEWPLTNNSVFSLAPHVSPDGSRVVYAASEGSRRRFYVKSLDHDTAYMNPFKICENCGWLWGWSPDGTSVMYDPDGDNWEDGKSGIALLNVASGKIRIAASDRSVAEQEISRDGAWIAHADPLEPGRPQVFISHFNGSLESDPRIAPVADWIAITPGDFKDTSPIWSPDGNLLYYLSPRDGGLCIWVQRLNPITKRPLGAPWAVYHMHRPSLGIKQFGWEIPVGLSLGGNQLIFAQAERSGTIWTTAPPRL